MHGGLKPEKRCNLGKLHQDASSMGVTVPPLCPTPIWQAHVISTENIWFYLLSCLDIEIRPPKLVLGTSSDSARPPPPLTGDILSCTACLHQKVKSNVFFCPSLCYFTIFRAPCSEHQWIVQVEEGQNVSTVRCSDKSSYLF